MFIRKWTRNPKARLVVDLTAGAASGLVFGVVVLEPLYAYLNMSLAGETGWAEYAFYGACGALGAQIFGRIRRATT